MRAEPSRHLPGGVGYAVLDGKKLMDLTVAGDQTFLWTRQTRDCSSAATGSALFDFDGDGRAEAVYADEISLHVYESATGNDRFTACNTSGTLIEYPGIADVDNDGQADIVVVSNAYAFTCTNGLRTSGVRVFSSLDNNWVRTRRIWNQPEHEHDPRRMLGARRHELRQEGEVEDRDLRVRQVRQRTVGEQPAHRAARLHGDHQPGIARAQQRDAQPDQVGRADELQHHEQPR